MAESVDKLVPGKRYASMQDVFAGKAIEGTGMGKRVGRPKKIKVEVSLIPVVKKGRGRPRKVC